MKKSIWIVVGLMLVIAGAMGVRRWMKKPEPPREVAVERGRLQIKILSTGMVQPENRIELKPPIAGRAEEVIAREGESVRKGQILAWMSSTERAALLDAARAKGPDELAHWEDLYKPTPMMAPLAGTIIARKVEPGQTLTASDSVFVLSDRLIVKGDVDETDIGRIRRGMPVRFNLDSFPEIDIPGRVLTIAEESRTINNVTTYQVDILPETVPPFMKSGMTANVTFLGEKREGVLLVPAETLRYENGEATVQKIDPADPKSAQTRSVKTGLSDGKSTEILEGLAEGDRLRVPELAAGARDPKVNPLGMNAPRRGRGAH